MLSEGQIKALIDLANGHSSRVHRLTIRSLTNKRLVNYDMSVTKAGYDILNNYYKNLPMQKTQLPPEIGIEWNGFGNEHSTIWRGEHDDVRSKTPEYWRMRFRLIK